MNADSPNQDAQFAAKKAAEDAQFQAKKAADDAAFQAKQQADAAFAAQQQQQQLAYEQQQQAQQQTDNFHPLRDMAAIIVGVDLLHRLDGVTPVSPLAGDPKGGTIVQAGAESGFKVSGAGLDAAVSAPKPNPVQQFLANPSQG